MKRLFFLLLLGACAPIEDYKPRVENPRASYEKDLQACHAAARKRLNAALYSDYCRRYGTFGLLGAAAAEAANPGNDCNKKMIVMVDECLSQSGYRIESPNK